MLKGAEDEKGHGRMILDKIQGQPGPGRRMCLWSHGLCFIGPVPSLSHLSESQCTLTEQGEKERLTHLPSAHLLNELQPLLDVRLPFLPLHQCLQGDHKSINQSARVRMWG